MSAVETKVVRIRKSISIVLSGSLNPVHCGHVGLLIEVKKFLEEKFNYTVVNGFLAPSSDKYVLFKLGEGAMGLKDRIEMCKLAAVGHDWMKVCVWGIASSVNTARKLERETKHPVLQIGGADYVFKSKLWRYPFICFGRKGDTERVMAALKNNKINKDFIMIEKEIPDDISSTVIRKYFMSGDYVTAVKLKLIPESVGDYLKRLGE